MIYQHNLYQLLLLLSSRCKRSILPGLLALCAPLAAYSDVILPPPPPINAKGYLLIDYHSDQVLAERNSEQRLEPASLTKMLTAYVVASEMAKGGIQMSDEVTISEKAWRTEGSRMFVEVGKKVSVENLLKGIIIQSGNDATVALVEHVAGSEDAFVSLMNQHAARLGMTGSHFVNSTGLPHPDHYTTARDLARLSRALIRDYPEHYNWYSQKEFFFNNIKQYNRNKLLWRNEAVDGIKTGHTESAGYCLVASAVRDNMRLIAVILGTNSEEARAEETQKLLGFGFRFFETHRLYAANEPLTKVHVWKGASEELPLGLSEDLFLTIPKGQYKNLGADMNVETRVIAPTARGDSLGTVNIRLGSEQFAQRDLVALADIGKGGFFGNIIDEIKLWFE